MLTVLPLNVASFIVRARFLEAIADVEEAFKECFWGENSNARTQISMKAPICGVEFPMCITRHSITHHK